MSESRLYLDAKAALSSDDERESLEHVLEWMNQRVSSKPDYFPKTAWNVRREHNLIGDSTPHEHSAYTEFLGMVAGLDTVAVGARHQEYLDACDVSLMKGRTVKHVLPARIY